MDRNWILAMDNLAAGGVIDFDAASYLLDKPARFVGHPDRESIPLGDINYLPKGIKLKDVPRIDGFEHSEDKPLIHNSTWKKLLVGGVLGLGAIIGGIYANTITKKVKKHGFYNILKIIYFKNKKNIFSKIKFPKIKFPKIKSLKAKLPKFNKIGRYIKVNFAKINKSIKNMISKIKIK